jgi:ATP-dependent RNA helicase RhlE
MIEASRFAALGLSEPLLRSVAQAGYHEPTPIQVRAIPEVLGGADLLAAAQTGTGKTAAFVLPILHRLTRKPGALRPRAPRCLIVAPTRELAAQVEAAVRTYGKHLKIGVMAIFGGVAIQPQIDRLRKHVDILVATPGRLLDHVERRSVDLSGIEILVLDEADRMLDMGFLPDIKRVLAMLPRSRQTLLFSATFPKEIRTLAQGVLRNHETIDVAPQNMPIELVDQSVHLCAKSEKPRLLCHVLRENDWRQVLVFTKTKHAANRLVDKLRQDGIRAAAIHGNKSQSARVRALAEFKSGVVPVLVATDIAARGLDIEQLPQVVNFELPNVPEDYVHRIGRTGRAGSSGAALSLVDHEEIGLLCAIERLIRKPIQRVSVKGFPLPPPAGRQVSQRVVARSSS